ncbi:spore germination protein KA [Paenibacillus cisolokensis]|uniref:Spore germination protein KA n=1 Tax=Paenibacillus cisolokensis TaxID=1658519 RepID=A0ABQ4N6V2_9BACL|nr:spore germination protein [Paenibacillus cisolokensis]GIQ63906.1 spore germination protein KA [Paenibacillus cisolokensis]
MNALTQKDRWTEQKLRDLFAGSADVVIQTCRYGEQEILEVVMVYAEGLCNSQEIGKTVFPELKKLYRLQGSFDDPLVKLSSSLPLRALGGASSDQLAEAVFQGDLLLLFAKENVLCSIDLSDRPMRQPQESNTEISVKGPKDGFVEDIAVNIALIRKRLRDPSLHVEITSIGRRTKTKVGLMYFHDILDPAVLKEVRSLLSRLDVDGLFSIYQLEAALTKSKFNILPLMDFTGRPDYAVSSLLAGRFVLIVDGLPMVLIAPATLSFILKSPEDTHFNYTYVSFARVIRIISLFLSIFLPAIWVALMAFHPDQVPFRILATVSVTRMGVPLSAPMEMFLLLMLLEIFREAGVRLPNAIGQTLTSIGGLIIGDAAIRAGLVSPSVVVVGAITAVSGVTLVNQSLSTQVSILRLFFFILSALLGMYGVILGMVLLLAYMSSLRSFGVGYLIPLSPIVVKDLVVSFYGCRGS